MCCRKCRGVRLAGPDNTLRLLKFLSFLDDVRVEGDGLSLTCKGAELAAFPRKACLRTAGGSRRAPSVSRFWTTSGAHEPDRLKQNIAR